MIRSDMIYRPIPLTGGPRPESARRIAGGPVWFASAALHRRGMAPVLVPISDIPEADLGRLTARRPDLLGLSLDRPRIMGILNTTPDSFSDGGRHLALVDALERARALIAAGADILDIGGESTRPGAEPVPVEEEIARTLPVIRHLRAEGITTPISIDTRNAATARAAFEAGADLFNDVSALTHDPDSLAVARGHAVCLMHSQGDPRRMQDNPTYDDVLLDIHDHLARRLRETGLDPARTLIDPGIGFGKTVAHNLVLIRNLALFHALGAPILLGASRKSFIGRLSDAPSPADRVPGSLAVALEALRQGCQMIRCHDVSETRAALSLWMALNRDDHEA